MRLLGIYEASTRGYIYYVSLYREKAKSSFNIMYYNFEYFSHLHKGHTKLTKVQRDHTQKKKEE